VTFGGGPQTQDSLLAIKFKGFITPGSREFAAGEGAA